MNIMVVTDAWDPQVNGVVRHIKDLSDSLNNTSIQYTIITPKDFQHRITLSTADAVEWVLFGKKQFSQLVKTIAPTHIHAMTEGSLGIIARKYAQQQNIPFSTSFHSHWAYFLKERYSIPTTLSWKYIKWFHQHSDIVYIPSQPLRSLFTEKTQITNTKILENTVDTSLFQPYSDTMPTNQKKKKIALYVGRIAPEKNLEEFLSLSLPHLEKRVVGDGPSRNILKKKYPDVVFTGIKKNKDLVQEYQNANIVVFPSLSDTFGIVLLEAIACGKAIAALPSFASKNLKKYFPEYLHIHPSLETAIGHALKKNNIQMPKNINLFTKEALGPRFIESLQDT